MAKSINSREIAASLMHAFTKSSCGVSGFASWLSISGRKSAAGRVALSALGLDYTAAELTQKAVYTAIKKHFPYRDAAGRMVLPSKVVCGVWSPSAVGVVSVDFISAIIDGGSRVTLPAFYSKDKSGIWPVAADYVNEGVNLDSAVRAAVEVSRVAAADLTAAEVSHSRAVCGGAGAAEVENAAAAVAVAAAAVAAADKNAAAARAAFEGWQNGLTAFRK